MPAGTAIEIWFQDEARVGQKNTLVRQWARRGTRPRQPKDQRHASCYIFGAVCPQRDEGVGIVASHADAKTMQIHLEEISRHVRPGAHGVVVLDGAGWHKARSLKVPDNLSLLFLPPYAPELNPVENIWQYLRQRWLANRVFDGIEDILDACCKAWTPSSQKTVASPPSHPENGASQVNDHAGWYYTPRNKGSRRHARRHLR